jgi:hypothetical protein
MRRSIGANFVLPLWRAVRYASFCERCSSGPSTGFEIIVPGRQDGYGHQSCLQERQSL